MNADEFQAGCSRSGVARGSGPVVDVNLAAVDVVAVVSVMRGAYKRHHLAQRAAVLSILIAFVNYRFAGLDPLALAVGE
ncbi:hypothetical protein [Streptomyces canus]|uniref:hypothetical protein n=1 Tax=Streptomyces canus TaxID=58343 RepID=UPI002E2BB5D3|nr:hypothetical protein [Streptomyces canus]